jgi:isocitrate lyase
MNTQTFSTEQLKQHWQTDARWVGITRGYSAEEVVRLRGTVAIDHSLARLGAGKLWNSLNSTEFVNALGAMTGNQAMQQVKAGLKAIYLSGWQVAADANVAGEMYPDQSLYPANSVPLVVKRKSWLEPTVKPAVVLTCNWFTVAVMLPGAAVARKKSVSVKLFSN